ncbi:MAG: hypothetical protein ACXVPN_14125 [Bacteroidia bacterium]
MTNTLQDNKRFDTIFKVVSIVTFVIVALRSYFVPFNHDEAATFFYFIQSGKYLPFFSDADANNHILNSILGNFCFHLFGSSPFALRLPNLLGFLILIAATRKFAGQLIQFWSKIFLTLALLASFHWISFFSACRGYGLSLSLLLLGLAFMLEYLRETSNFRKFAISILLFQLAISANLILMIVVLLLSGIILIVQFTNKNLFRTKTLAVWAAHFAIIYFWSTYSFFLKEKGALYYGAGDSYWQVTFKTLFYVITGFNNKFLHYELAATAIVVLLIAVYINKDNLFKIGSQLKNPSVSLLLAFVLGTLIVGFYAMHKLKDINYPEDRTGLFFFLFFVLLMAFTFDGFAEKTNKIIFSAISGIIILHFIFNLNFRKHSLYVYETIPQHFYDTLVKEQGKSKEKITIGGHRVRELFYDFMNYRNNGALNPVEPSETMHMNTDYCLGTKAEEKYYKDYYEEIDSEPDWGFVVLKRKTPVVRTLVAEVKDKNVEGEWEFLEVYKSENDSLCNFEKAIQAEFTFDVNKINVPAYTWIVLQVNDSAGQVHSYKRYPLQWSGYNLNGRKEMNYSLISEILPEGKKTVVCYFWNIDKTPVQIKLTSLKIYSLSGDGVNYIAPDVQ